VSKIIDAVSIVITCGDEIFAIQRQNYLKAFPGYWAFPGGKVEKNDEEHFVTSDLTRELDPKLFGAALRECREELGVDLGKEILEGNIGRIDVLGLAVTPDFNPFRFATTFYRLDLKNKVDFIVDHNEASLATWMSAADLMKRYHGGGVLAVPPVIKVIETLGSNPQVTSIPDLNFSYDSERHVPYIESLRSVRQLMPLSHTLPPASRTNAFLIGDEGPKILLDPSPKDQAEYVKLKNTIELFGIDKVMLTHHHPDHHERSVQLAQDYGIPMMMSQDTFERLSRMIPGYFEGVKIEFLKQGDKVTKWLGREVIVHEVPGHDEGQLALAPEDLSWFIAGDLFQGVGTVVIGDDEGDMKKYFQTLEKIISLNPRVVFPSHGIGLGGVAILEATLAHRKQREEQILKLTQEGHGPQQILEELYKEVDQRLWPYAMKNILKHLDKLHSEGRL
jgi:glyoxylase-like metal-dependent hydrolase (beta-lactamase superfamily II)/8-oxo-dGTP pyrophosphatase MutT (NUDIX family)